MSNLENNTTHNLKVTGPEQWSAQEKQKDIILPEQAARIDATVTKEGPLFLCSIPREIIFDQDSSEHLAEYFFERPERIHFYAVVNEEKAVKALIVSDQEINDYESLRRSLTDSREESTGDYYQSVPVVYDERRGWLVIPVTTEVIRDLQDSEKSAGPSGTHYQVRKYNVFMDQLCGSDRIQNIIEDDHLLGIRYFDIAEGPSSTLYINATSDRLREGVPGALQALGVKTADELPAFVGSGSLSDVIETAAGRKLYDYELERIIIASFNCQQMDRQLPTASLKSAFNIPARSQEGRELAKAFVSTYRHEIGYPAAALMISSKDYQGNDRLRIIVGKTHPDIERSPWYREDSKVIARLDGVLRVRAPHGQTEEYSHGGLNFDYYWQRATTLEGGTLEAEVWQNVQDSLKTIERESSSDAKTKEGGLRIVRQN